MHGRRESFVARRGQSDKVKPLPCTLTEVFHATAAWRQNPTKLAGIAFQTGMPVNNVRSPVISITIIRSGLGHVPAYRQASSPPPLFLPSTIRFSEPIHVAITSISFRCGCWSIVSSSPARSRPSSSFKANLQPAMHLPTTAITAFVGVCGCEMLSEIMRRRPRRSALCRLDRKAATSVDVR